MSGKRLLVCGGRDFEDEAYVFNMLSQYEDEYGPFSIVIHGGAKGADTLAGRFASMRHIPTKVFVANWRRHGRAAGPIRNKRMLIEGKPDLVIAFPGGRGTANMVAQARDAGVKTIDVERHPWP